jgi:hypothetical protein
VLVVVLVLENPDRFAMRLTEQISSIGLFAVTESQCTEDEHDDEDEDDSKFRNLGLSPSKCRINMLQLGVDALSPTNSYQDAMRRGFTTNQTVSTPCSLARNRLWTCCAIIAEFTVSGSMILYCLIRVLNGELKPGA